MLWLLSTILAYAHKIPFIRNIIAMLSLYYGRTTIWKVLVKIRKLFIFFNAVIGVYMVFKTTGFGYDTFLANFVALGNTYLEIFVNFTKRLFHWFFELFDHKIVPNLPNNPPSPKSYSFWSPRGIDHAWNILIPNTSNLPSEWYKPYSININTSPWYKDLYNWLWLGGVITISAVSITALVITYKLISDPSIVVSWFKSTSANVDPINPTTIVTPSSPEGSTGSITPTGVTKSIVIFLTNNVKKLNPIYWFASSVDYETQYNNFAEAQQSAVAYNNTYYPFTKLNPYAPWYEKLRISILGETTQERIARHLLKREYLDAMILGSSSETISPIASTSTLLSPSVATIGLGTGDPYYAIANKFNSVPTTPTLSPLALNTSTLPNVNPFSNPIGDAIDRLTTNNNSNELDDVIPLPSDWVVSNSGKHK